MLTKYHNGGWTDIDQLKRGSEPIDFLRRYDGKEWIDMYTRELVLFRAGEINAGFTFTHNEGSGCILTSNIDNLKVVQPLKSGGLMQSIPVDFSRFKKIYVKYDVLNLSGPQTKNGEEISFEYRFFTNGTGKFVELKKPVGRFVTIKAGSYTNIECVYDISEMTGIQHLIGAGPGVARSYTPGGSLIYEVYFSYTIKFDGIWLE